MLFNLLDSTSATQQGGGGSSLIVLLILVAIMVVFMVINTRSQKKRQKETQNMLDAIQPGNTVKTIGGICGTVVEVNAEENTFVLETGSEESGKSYIKFDKQAVYQTDAVAKKEETPVEETSEETPFEETDAITEETTDAAPVEETTEETTDAE